MLKKILIKDLKRNKVISMTLFLFIVLASILVASATNIVVDLTKGIDVLFTKASAPHFVQMHAGSIDQKKIDDYSKKNKLVKKQQSVEMLNVSGSSISFDDGKSTEADGIMDISFVKQNKSFDFLLDLDNKPANITVNKIGIPIYYRQKNNLKIGDTFKLKKGSFEMNFKISHFIRDVQMNPALIHSKRFVVNEQDWSKIKTNLGENEYLIEFLLNDSSKTTEFEKDYQSTNLPRNGVIVTQILLQTINALSDGIVVLVIILVSILLIMIALLCLRYTIIATMEDDYREIGIMKALGLKSKSIQKLYLQKYLLLAGGASIVGYIIAIFISNIFTDNISLYFGKGSKTLISYLLPILSVMIVFVIVVLFTYLILRRFRDVSAIEAIRVAQIGNVKKKNKLLTLHKNKGVNLNILIGLKDVLNNIKTYILLVIIFIISAFIIIVPINILSTIESSDFVSYMGTGKSDIRIDIPYSKNINEEFDKVEKIVENDKDIVKYVPLVTNQLQVLNDDGTKENLNVESGDFKAFPLKYLSGKTPDKVNEIAISVMNSDELGKKVNQKIKIDTNNKIHEYVVSGIYQDITNGGKTAKMLKTQDDENIQKYTINLKTKSNLDIKRKINSYSKEFSYAKVTNVKEFLNQTLGSTISQLKMLSVLIILVAISISILITALFFKMLISKDATQIAILKSIGFSFKNLRLQYLTRSLIVLIIGIIIGTISANTLGQSLVSGITSGMGASNIQFVINPLNAYVVSPLLLIFVVTITIVLSSNSLKKECDLKLIAE